MNTIRSLFVCFASCVLLTLASGCELIGPDGSPAVELRTDQSVYAASSNITLTITNRAEEPVYYLCTGFIVLQEMDGAGRARHAWTVHGTELCARHTPLEGGQSLRFTFDLADPVLKERLAGASFDASVGYRFVFDLYGDAGLDHPLDEESRRSNRFVVLRDGP